jgi:ATP-dependent RNA helicase DDX21
VRTSETVDHFALLVRPDERHHMVTQLIQKYNPDKRTIIFTKTKAEANDFIKFFDQNEMVILHGDISQNIREYNMSQFKKGTKKILIATDIAARGLDIPDVELIIQLSPPENPEPYIHRSGRTGRAGKDGLNITFFDESNVKSLLDIEAAANIKIKLINKNFNISLWKNQVAKLVQKVITAPKSAESAIY